MFGYHFISGINFDQIRNPNETGPYLLVKHETNIDYIIDNQTIMGIEGGFSSMNFPGKIPAGSDPVPNAIKINFYYIGVNFKTFFSSGPGAPVGSYLKFKGGALQDNYTATAWPGGKAISSTSKTFSHTYIGFGYGKMRVFNDWLVLDMGLDFNFIPNYSGPFFPLFDGQKSLSENPYRESIHRIAQTSLVNYHIGIEGLLGRSHR